MKVLRKLGIVGAAAGAVFVLLPMAAASAAHNITTPSLTCVNFTGNTPFDGVQVALAGLGSDNPRNALVAGRARVSTAAACNRTNGINPVRIQIDKVSLMTSSSILASSGPKGHGNTFVVQDSPGVRKSCTTNYRIGVRFSVRYADGTLGKGFANSGFFRAPC